MDSIALMNAQADLDTGMAGLASTAVPDPQTTTSIIQQKLDTLATAKQQKLNLVPKTFAPDLEDVTITGFVDADTAKLDDGRTVRVSGMGRYDAAEVKHDYTGILPESIANMLPTWMPGAAQDQKSEYAAAKQKEQAGMLLGKSSGDVTPQDVHDVGNMQQLQAIADLTQSAGQERFTADINPGGDYVNLNDKTSPLNIKAKIDRNASKDQYGRVLTPLYNAETGQNVTDLAVTDPRLNAFASGVPEPTKFDMANTAKGAVSGALQMGAGVADAATTLGATIVKGAADAVDKSEWYTEADKKVASDFWNKYKDSEWANKTAGYDPKYTQDRLASALVNFKEGNIFKGIVNAVKAGPGVTMDSLAYMATLASVPGMALAISSEFNDSIEAFQKNNKGQEPSSLDLVRMLVIDTAKVYTEKLPFEKAIHGSSMLVNGLKDLVHYVPDAQKGVILKALAKTGTGLTGNLIEEGGQEGLQNVMDYYNREYNTAADKGLNTDELYKAMIGGAAAGGFTGSTGRVANGVLGVGKDGGLIDTVAGKVGFGKEKVEEIPSMSWTAMPDGVVGEQTIANVAGLDNVLNNSMAMKEFKQEVHAGKPGDESYRQKVAGAIGSMVTELNGVLDKLGEVKDLTPEQATARQMVIDKLTEYTMFDNRYIKQDAKKAVLNSRPINDIQNDIKEIQNQVSTSTNQAQIESLNKQLSVLKIEEMVSKMIPNVAENTDVNGKATVQDSLGLKFHGGVVNGNYRQGILEYARVLADTALKPEVRANVEARLQHFLGTQAKKLNEMEVAEKTWRALPDVEEYTDKATGAVMYKAKAGKNPVVEYTKAGAKWKFHENSQEQVKQERDELTVLRAAAQAALTGSTDNIVVDKLTSKKYGGVAPVKQVRRADVTKYLKEQFDVGKTADEMIDGLVNDLGVKPTEEMKTKIRDRYAKSQSEVVNEDVTDEDMANYNAYEDTESKDKVKPDDTIITEDNTGDTDGKTDTREDTGTTETNPDTQADTEADSRGKTIVEKLKKQSDKVKIAVAKLLIVDDARVTGTSKLRPGVIDMLAEIGITDVTTFGELKENC